MSYRRRRALALVVAVAGVAVVVGACLTAYNRYKFTPLEGSPPVAPRPEGCNVDVFEEGDRIGREHVDIGRIVLDWPEAKIREQGPDGAIKTLKAAACENGAHIIKGMRALTTGTQHGLVYEATLAALLDEQGKPINPAPATDGSAGSATPPNRLGW